MFSATERHRTWSSITTLKLGSQGPQGVSEHSWKPVLSSGTLTCFHYFCIEYWKSYDVSLETWAHGYEKQKLTVKFCITRFLGRRNRIGD